MDYTRLLNELKEASAFDLYRLHVAIGNELENPKHVFNIKKKLRIGMRVSYFYRVDNRSVSAILLEMHQKNVIVLDQEKNTRCTVPYYMLNVDGMDTEIYNQKNTDPLTANTIKVGDCVGFNKEGQTIVGIVRRINQKTVTLLTPSGHQWRVAYAFLYRVHDAEMVHQALL